MVLTPFVSGQNAERTKNRISGQSGTLPPGSADFSLVKAKASSSAVPDVLLPPASLPAGQFGIVVLNNGSIRLFDTKSLTMYGPFLAEQLGYEGYTWDVALNKHGKTALISNFVDGKVFFIDLTNTIHPQVSGEVQLSFFAEDVALAPNGKFAVVTDGGFTSAIASLNVATKTIVQELDLSPYYAYANACAIAKDNQTVITADYYSGYCDYLRLDPKTGSLVYQNSIDVSPARPLDVVIAPNGKTAFALNAWPGGDAGGFGAVLSITGPGAVELKNWLPVPDADVYFGYTAVYSPNGRKLYIHGGHDYDEDAGYRHFIYVYNVSPKGVITYSGHAIELYEFEEMAYSFFGIDSMAVSPDGKFLYVSNHVQSGARNRVAVVDLKLYKHMKSLNPAVEAGDFPVGIAFNK